jgi:small subunit ribosomal protein S2
MKVDIKDLLEAGVHFGHRTQRWNPKMKPFIFEARNGIYVIDLTKTVSQLETAMNFLRDLSTAGGKTLFVGCKKQAQEAIKELAPQSNSFYVTERWLGGTLTNLQTIRKSVNRMKQIDDLEKKGGFERMPKQEVSVLRRENTKLHKNLDGVREMNSLPQALVIVDTPREEIAVKEAKRLGIPVVAIVDTNSDPDVIDYPIAGNDDAIRAIRVVLEALNNAVIEGKSQLDKKRGEKTERKSEAPAAESLTGVSA